MTMAAVREDNGFMASGDWKLYQMVKDHVTTLEAASRYGIAVNRRGMCRCPFHKDKNPSMKIDKRFHCFGCQADGDVISFTSRLFGLTRKGAALKLAADFDLRLDSRRLRIVPIPHRTVSEEEKIEHCAAHYFRELCSYRQLLVNWREVFAPQKPNDSFDPRFVEAIHMLPLVEDELDTLWSGDIQSKKAVIDEIRQRKEKEVISMEGTVNIPVYYQDGSYARDHKELELFRSSHMENINCKKAIEAAISRDFDGIRLRKTAADEVLDTYGAERVSLVLAATVQTKSWDGRFSQQNKDWAFTIRMPDNRPEMDYDRRDAYAVTSHPAVLDGFINLARRGIQERSKVSVRDELNHAQVSIPKPSLKKDGIER